MSFADAKPTECALFALHLKKLWESRDCGATKVTKTREFGDDINLAYLVDFEQETLFRLAFICLIISCKAIHALSLPAVQGNLESATCGCSWLRPTSTGTPDPKLLQNLHASAYN
jgi:hypothetical protein